MSEAKKRRQFERADGRICVTARIDGKKHFFYGQTKAEAQRKRDEYKAAHTVGLRLSPGLSVSRWMDEWLRVYDVDQAQYKPYLDRMRADLGSLPLSSVTEAHLVMSMKHYAGKSASGATKYRSILGRCFGKAYKNRLIPFNPASDLDLPKGTTEGTHRALERWEVELILNYWSVHHAGLWAMLMLLAGLRRGEMVALDWANVDLEKRLLCVCQTGVRVSNKFEIADRAKTAAGVRFLPICSHLYAALNSVPESRRTGPVCLSQRGTQLSGSAFTRGWDGFLLAMSRVLNGEPVHQQGRRVDIEKRRQNAEAEGRSYQSYEVRPHDLRHTFATILYDSGTDVKTASYLLGHADPRITLDIYTHLTKERERRSAATLTGFMDSWQTAAGSQTGSQMPFVIPSNPE